ncbi:GTP cyclohydrolase I FolE [Bacteroidota bacterium]
MFNDLNYNPLKVNTNHSKMIELNELIETEQNGDDHHSNADETPLLPDAFLLNDDEKIRIIQDHFRGIMKTLGLDLNDDSLSGTPYRVAKMYVKEIFQGLNPENKPHAKSFDNSYKYNEMLLEKNISVKSYCEHHFVPITGKAHVAYISSGRVVGLSKLNRIVDYYSRRPQVQERLTMQIANELKKALNTEDVAVIIEASHMCVSTRGIQDEGSTTVTSSYSGQFKNVAYRQELIEMVKMDLKK